MRNVSGDIDFSDPFLCEMEIGRLSNENQALASQLEEISVKVINVVILSFFLFLVFASPLPGKTPPKPGSSVWPTARKLRTQEHCS